MRNHFPRAFSPGTFSLKDVFPRTKYRGHFGTRTKNCKHFVKDILECIRRGGDDAAINISDNYGCDVYMNIKSKTNIEFVYVRNNYQIFHATNFQLISDSSS